MAKMYRKNGSEISTCIIAQVNFKLRLSSKQPKNSKTCSDFYWNEVVTLIVKK